MTMPALDTSKLAGKVAYVRAKLDDTRKNAPTSVAVAVWMTFYAGVRFRQEGTSTVIGEAFDLVELPSVREVRAIMRRADLAPLRELKPMGEDWHQNRTP